MKKSLKIAAGIVLLVILVSAIANRGDDSESKTAAKAEPAASLTERELNDGFSDDAAKPNDQAEKFALASEGEELSQKLGEWASDGQSDPMGACAELPTALADVARIREIVREMSQLDSVTPVEISRLRKSTGALAANMPGMRQNCAALGL